MAESSSNITIPESAYFAMLDRIGELESTVTALSILLRIERGETELVSISAEQIRRWAEGDFSDDDASE